MMEFNKIFYITEDLNKIIENTTFLYLTIYFNDTLFENQSVTDACITKNGKVSAITDELIKKIPNEKTLHSLLNKINMKSNLLKNVKKCRETILAKFNNLNNNQNKINNSQKKVNEEIDKLIEKIKEIILELIAKAKKWKIHIPFTESKNEDEYFENTILKFLISNQLNLKEDITFNFDKFYEILKENNENPLAKLSNYILMLKKIKNKIEDLLSKEELNELNNWIKEFTKKYNELKMKN
jgi:hypothetical protein